MSFKALVCHEHSPKQSSEFDPKSLKKLIYCQALVNVNIAFWILQSDHSIQGCLIDNKGFLFRMLAADSELMISDLNPYRLFPQYWGLIQNESDALISAFSTIMIAAGLNVLESQLSLSMINYSYTSSMWLWLRG